MSTILEALAVIKAKDQTGGALESVTQKVNRMSRAWSALSRDVEKHIALGQRAEVQASRMARAGQAIGNGAKMAGAVGGAYAGSTAARAIATHLAKSGADRGHEEVRMRAAGMTDKEVKEAEELARATSAKYKSISTTEIMHSARNIRSVVGTFEEATKIIDPLMKLRVVAQGAHPEKAEELGEDFDKLIKGMEIKGVTQDHAKFEHYIDNMAKAVNVFGDTLRPTDFYEMFKYGRAATNALGDDFMLKTAPTLAQELGGSSAGKALSSFHTQFVGGKMSNKAVEMLDKYGLIDKSKVIKTKTGAVKGVLPGGVVGGEYLRPGQEDPYAWTNKVLLPHLASKGVTDPAEIQEAISALASQQTTAQMMNIFATQQKRIEKDWELIHLAHGTSAADEYLKSDPKVAQQSVQKQFDNYFGDSAQPFTQGATSGMNWLASGLNYMSGYAKENPTRNAAGLTFLSTLSAAMSADAMGGLFQKWNGTGDFASQFKAGFSRMSLMLAPILDIATRKDILPANATATTRRLSQMLDQDKLNRLADLDDADKAASIYGDKDFEAQAIARNKGERDRLESELAAKGYAGPGVPGRGMMAGSYTVDDMQRALGIGGGAGEPVKAEVVGEATLKTEVTVSPSPDFLTRISQTVQNGINAFKNSGGGATGTTGSTGRGMPEAGPPQ
jgi:hypothetical protein